MLHDLFHDLIDALRRRRSAVGAALFLCFFGETANASFLSGEALDTAADVIALIVLFVVPPALIVVFWLVHILPEKVAEQREHPQKEAIKVLCLLSLVFGGLLWPIAWILAYSKPVLHRAAYGRDKHDDYYRHAAEQNPTDDPPQDDEVARLHATIDELAERGALPEDLDGLRAQLERFQRQLGIQKAQQEAR